MIWLSDKNALDIKVFKKTYSIWWKNITFETGKMWFLADWSVTISDDNWNVLFITSQLKQDWVDKNASFFL